MSEYSLEPTQDHRQWCQLAECIRLHVSGLRQLDILDPLLCNHTFMITLVYELRAFSSTQRDEKTQTE